MLKILELLRSLHLRMLIWIGVAAGLLLPARLEAEDKPVVLTLEKAIELGMETDQSLRQAAQAITIAEAQVTQAKSYALPHLSLSGQYGRNIKRPSFFIPEDFRPSEDTPARVEMGEDNDFMGAATLEQVLWASGRVSAGLNAAREFLETFRYQEIATADYVRFIVQEAYYNVLLANAILDISSKALQAAEEGLRVADAGSKQGTASKFDIMRAEVEVANRRAPLVVAQNDVEQSMSVLLRRCGLAHDAEVIIPDSLRAIARPTDLDTFLGVMRETSAEILALDHYVGAQEQFVRIAKAERYPTLGLTAYWGIQAQWSQGFLPDDQLVADNAAIQIGFNIPIFDGLLAKGKIREAKAELRTAELELEKVTRDKELAVRRSWLMLENAVTALEGRREAVALAEEAYRLALIRLENGLATPLERLDAELAMTTARGQYVEALYACKIAQSYLELAVGSRGFGKIEAYEQEAWNNE
jgi:outer membrane protein TolC